VAVGEVDAVELHAAAAGRHQAADDAVQRGLAGAVAAEQRHDLAAVHLQVDAPQHVGATISATQAAHLEQRAVGIHAATCCSRAAVPWPR
jgi:hypothetical protein